MIRVVASISLIHTLPLCVCLCVRNNLNRCLKEVMCEIVLRAEENIGGLDLLFEVRMKMQQIILLATITEVIWGGKSKCCLSPGMYVCICRK